MFVELHHLVDADDPLPIVVQILPARGGGERWVSKGERKRRNDKLSLFSEVWGELVEDEGVWGGEFDAVHVPSEISSQSGIELLEITEPLPDAPLEDLFLLHLSACEAKLADDFIFHELGGGEVIDSRSPDDGKKRGLVFFGTWQKTIALALPTPTIEGGRDEWERGKVGLLLSEVLRAIHKL
jgi:hypothetical protein